MHWPSILVLYCPSILVIFCPIRLLLYCPNRVMPHCPSVLVLYCPSILAVSRSLSTGQPKCRFLPSPRSQSLRENAPWHACRGSGSEVSTRRRPCASGTRKRLPVPDVCVKGNKKKKKMTTVGERRKADLAIFCELCVGIDRLCVGAVTALRGNNRVALCT